MQWFIFEIAFLKFMLYKEAVEKHDAEFMQYNVVFDFN